MNILVLYQSRKGHTRQAAEAIATAARSQNHNVVVKSVIEVRKVDVEAENGCDPIICTIGDKQRSQLRRSHMPKPSSP